MSDDKTDLFAETLAYVEEQLRGRLALCRRTANPDLDPDLDELAKLVELADHVDEVRRRRAQHEEALAGFRTMAAKFGEAFGPALAKYVALPEEHRAALKRLLDVSKDHNGPQLCGAEVAALEYVLGLARST